MLNPWLALSFKAFQLGIEAQSVVALRMMRLASGGVGTQAEMGRMVVEKLQLLRKLNLLLPRLQPPGIRTTSSRRRHLRSSENECGPIGDAFHVARSALLL